MEQVIQHSFVNKPFYKWFHKCTECGKRKIWAPMAKCSGCHTYYHKRCIQLDDSVCRRSTTDVEITDQDQEIEVTLPEEDARDSSMGIQSDGGVRDLNPAEGDVVKDQETKITLTDEYGRGPKMKIRPDREVQYSNPADGDFVKDNPENNVDISGVENSMLAEQRPRTFAADNGDLDASTELQDQTSGAVYDDSNPVDGDFVKDNPENNVDISGVENSMLAEQRPRPFAVDSGDLDASTELQDQTSGAVDNDSVLDVGENSEGKKPPVDEIKAESVHDVGQYDQCTKPSVEETSAELVPDVSENDECTTPTVEETTAESVPDIGQNDQSTKPPVDDMMANDSSTSSANEEADELV